MGLGIFWSVYAAISLAFQHFCRITQSVAAIMRGDDQAIQPSLDQAGAQAVDMHRNAIGAGVKIHPPHLPQQIMARQALPIGLDQGMEKRKFAGFQADIWPVPVANAVPHRIKHQIAMLQHRIAGQ